MQNHGGDRGSVDWGRPDGSEDNGGAGGKEKSPVELKGWRNEA